MKTIRELLLERHAQAEPKLDTIRKEVVETVAASANKNREFTFAATLKRCLAAPFRELIWRPRWIWSGLAAVWLLILAMNLHLHADAPRFAGKSSPNTAEVILTLREQERVVAELTGRSDSAAVIAPKRQESRPRSEVLRTSAAT